MTCQVILHYSFRRKKNSPLLITLRRKNFHLVRRAELELLPEPQLVKMNTKFNRQHEINESAIPLQALFNPKLNKMRKEQDKNLIIKSPVTLYFDELRHQEQYFKKKTADADKLRLLVQGKSEIQVDLSKKKDQQIFKALKLNSAVLGRPGQVITHSSMARSNDMTVKKKDSLAVNIVYEAKKITDQTSKNIYTTLSTENSRYGKLAKEFFLESLKNEGEFKLGSSGDHTKRSILEELRANIPQSKLSNIQIKQPELDKYSDIPKLSQSKTKVAAFNTRWYLKPKSWNNTERVSTTSSPSSPANSHRKKKITSNNILGKIIKQVEKSTNVWEKVSEVEQKIKDATQTKDTMLRDNLIDFFK